MHFLCSLLIIVLLLLKFKVLLSKYNGIIYIVHFVHLVFTHLVLFSLSKVFHVFIVSFFLYGVIIILDVFINVTALLYRYDFTTLVLIHNVIPYIFYQNYDIDVVVVFFARLVCFEVTSNSCISSIDGILNMCEFFIIYHHVPSHPKVVYNDNNKRYGVVIHLCKLVENLVLNILIGISGEI